MSKNESSLYKSIGDQLSYSQMNEIDQVFENYTLSQILENLGTYMSVTDYHEPELADMNKLESNIENLLAIFESSIESGVCGPSDDISQYAITENFIAKYSKVE
jgi:hypothetical protein